MKNRLAPFLAALMAPALAGAEPDDISPQLQNLLEGSPVPSLTAAALVDGQIVSIGASGVRKQGDTTPVTLEDKYHLGSCTKSMTATLGAILIESGRLKWETTLAEVFPDVALHQDYRKVTFQQLVTNTGGTPADIEPGLWAELFQRTGTERDQRRQLVEGILTRPPAYPPGSQQVYSNAGFSIAGAMLETLMDQPYEQLMIEHLFKPLGMKSAGFRAPATPGQVDQPYGHHRKLFMTFAVDPEPQGDNPPAIAPAGAVHCSVTDFARYAAFHLGHGAEPVLSRAALQSLHQPVPGFTYAKGWSVVQRKWAGGAALTHSGSNTMFYAVIWIAPERNFAAVALCNYGGDEGFAKCDEAIGLLVKKHL